MTYFNIPSIDPTLSVAQQMDSEGAFVTGFIITGLMFSIFVVGKVAQIALAKIRGKSGIDAQNEVCTCCKQGSRD